MAEGVLTHSSLERLNSWHPLPSILDSSLRDAPPKLGENCSVAAKMVMHNFFNSDDIRSFKAELIPAVPAKAALAELQPEASHVVDAQSSEIPARPVDDVTSTSHVPEDVFSVDFAGIDVTTQAEDLFEKGPLRTLSSRTFESLLDDSSLQITAEWTALQNLPSLPRDETLPQPPDTLAETIKQEEDDAAARAAADVATAQPVGELLQEPGVTAEEEEMGVGMVDAAREKAVMARVKADQARRYATQKTAAATALTVQAMEILDVAASVKSRDTPSHKVSGLQTPSLSEDLGCKVEVESVSPTSSYSGHKRGHRGAIKGGKGSKASSGRHQQQFLDTGDETDLEDDGEMVFVPVAPPPKVPKTSSKSPSKKLSVKKEKEEKPRGIQATDSIVTINGKKCRRGCLNCQAQKTPQWRMGPDGPKTLCNACGVRYRKGLPL